MADIHVESLYSYPIKSCGPLAGEGFAVGPQGIAYDRQWVITRPNGTFLSQRTNPELALVQAALRDEALLVTAPDGSELAVPLEPAGDVLRPERSIEIFKKVGSGLDEGEVAAEFFSRYVGRRVRLLRSSQPRIIKPECQLPDTGSTIGFADGFPVLLASQQSFNKLAEAAPGPIDLHNFRPNIVVDGDDLEPYAEDYWRRLVIGPLAGSIVRACARCPMPNINQATGVLPRPAERFATQALQRTRRGIDPLSQREEVFFAQNMTIVLGTESHIRVGDIVDVITEDTEPNFTPISVA